MSLAQMMMLAVSLLSLGLSADDPEEEWPFVSCTVKVSNSKKNTT
jgi:hypothetical protein